VADGRGAGAGGRGRGRSAAGRPRGGRGGSTTRGRGAAASSNRGRGAAASRGRGGRGRGRGGAGAGAAASHRSRGSHSSDDDINQDHDDDDDDDLEEEGGAVATTTTTAEIADEDARITGPNDNNNNSNATGTPTTGTGPGSSRAEAEAGNEAGVVGASSSAVSLEGRLQCAGSSWDGGATLRPGDALYSNPYWWGSDLQAALESAATARGRAAPPAAVRLAAEGAAALLGVPVARAPPAAGAGGTAGKVLWHELLAAFAPHARLAHSLAGLDGALGLSPPQFAPPRCAACLSTGGVMKPTADGTNRWVHPLCVIFIPELYYQGLAPDERVCGLDSSLHARRMLSCVICRVRGGTCVQCDARFCFQAFHPTCGLKAGLLMRDTRAKRSFARDPGDPYAGCYSAVDGTLVGRLDIDDDEAEEEEEEGEDGAGAGGRDDRDIITADADVPRLRARAPFLGLAVAALPKLRAPAVTSTLSATVPASGSLSGSFPALDTSASGGVGSDLGVAADVASLGGSAVVLRCPKHTQLHSATAVIRTDRFEIGGDLYPVYSAYTAEQTAAANHHHHHQHLAGAGAGAGFGKRPQSPRRASSATGSSSSSSSSSSHSSFAGGLAPASPSKRSFSHAVGAGAAAAAAAATAAAAAPSSPVHRRMGLQAVAGTSAALAADPSPPRRATASKRALWGPGFVSGAGPGEMLGLTVSLNHTLSGAATPPAAFAVATTPHAGAGAVPSPSALGPGSPVKRMPGRPRKSPLPEQASPITAAVVAVTASAAAAPPPPPPTVPLLLRAAKPAPAPASTLATVRVGGGDSDDDDDDDDDYDADRDSVPASACPSASATALSLTAPVRTSPRVSAPSTPGKAVGVAADATTTPAAAQPAQSPVWSHPATPISDGGTAVRVPAGSRTPRSSRSLKEFVSVYNKALLASPAHAYAQQQQQQQQQQQPQVTAAASVAEQAPAQAPAPLAATASVPLGQLKRPAAAATPDSAVRSPHTGVATEDAGRETQVVPVEEFANLLPSMAFCELAPSADALPGAPSFAGTPASAADSKTDAESEVDFEILDSVLGPVDKKAKLPGPAKPLLGVGDGAERKSQGLSLGQNSSSSSSGGGDGGGGGHDNGNGNKNSTKSGSGKSSGSKVSAAPLAKTGSGSILSFLNRTGPATPAPARVPNGGDRHGQPMTDTAPHKAAE
jgi:hypothetical protein